MSLRETKVVLEGITVSGKTIIEHLEATNHNEAILYVEGLVSEKPSLSEWHIRNIHALVLKGIETSAGGYRTEKVASAQVVLKFIHPSK